MECEHDADAYVGVTIIALLVLFLNFYSGELKNDTNKLDLPQK